MAWIALSYRGEDYTAAQLIAASKRFLQDTGHTFQGYEIYDDCDLLMICATDAKGEESSFELPLDELPQWVRE